jgi:hypothetical protein
VGWETHKTMLNELVNEFPHMHGTVQLIQGLPGQNFDTWKQTLITVTKEKVFPMIFLNESLPASPAMRDKKYQETWNFEYADSLRFNGAHKYRGQFAASCISFSRKELVKMSMLSILSTCTSLINLWLLKNGIEKIQLTDLIDRFFLLDQVQKIEQNLYQNWTENNNYFFTINFDGKEDCISACAVVSATVQWLNNKSFLSLILKILNVTNQHKLDIFRTIKKELYSNYTKNLLLEHS